MLARHFLWRYSSWDYRRSCWVDSANLWRTQKDSVTLNLHLLQINSAPSPKILPVFIWMSLSKHQILDFLASFLRLLTQCAQSVRSDASINCKAPNLSALVFASISYKIERLVECVRVVQKFFKSWKPLKRSERSRNSPVQKTHSSWMDGPMNENRNLVTYIDLLRRSNCNNLMLLLNNHWAHSAYDIGPLNYSQILESLKRIKENANSILRVCRAQPLNPKRGHEDGNYSNGKKPRFDT